MWNEVLVELRCCLNLHGSWLIESMVWHWDSLFENCQLSLEGKFTVDHSNDSDSSRSSDDDSTDDYSSVDDYESIDNSTDDSGDDNNDESNNDSSYHDSNEDSQDKSTKS